MQVPPLCLRPRQAGDAGPEAAAAATDAVEGRPVTAAKLRRCPNALVAEIARCTLAVVSIVIFSCFRC